VKVGCKKAKSMYLRGDVSENEIVSRFERMTSYVLFIYYSDIAQARPKPSYVEVPG
jgi:hypothetical protein